MKWLYRGDQVNLRLPPFHCNLNPIELVWAQLKDYVARHNKTFKLADVRQLVGEGLLEVTADRWQGAIRQEQKM